jgi:hypothetical protein
MIAEDRYDMKKLFLLSLTGLSCAVCTALPPPSRIVLTEQATGEIQIRNETNVLWRCRPWEDPHLKLPGPGPFKLPAEVKPTDDGRAILFVASQTFGEIDVASARLKWYGRLDGCPHSIERLPDGRFAVACSWGKKVVLVDVGKAPFEPAKQKMAAFPLPHAHGVVWDEKRNCLWADGETELVAYDYRPDTFELVRRETIPFPAKDGKPIIACGHDLILRADGTLVVTGGDAFVYHPDKKTFTPLTHGFEVKCYDENRAGDALLTVAREKWWTDRLILRTPTGEKTVGPFKNYRIYKARWYKGTFFQ